MIDFMALLWDYALDSGGIAMWLLTALLRRLGLRPPKIYSLYIYDEATQARVRDKFAQLDRDEPLEMVVGRLVIKESYDRERVLSMRREFLRLFATLEVTSGPFVPSQIVDEFWHAFLLFTEVYREFCERQFGKMIEHRPRDHTSAPSSFEDEQAALKTLGLISNCFPNYDRVIWQSLIARVERIEEQRRVAAAEERERQDRYDSDPCSGCCSPDD